MFTRCPTLLCSLSLSLPPSHPSSFLPRHDLLSCLGVNVQGISTFLFLGLCRLRFVLYGWKRSAQRLLQREHFCCCSFSFDFPSRCRRCSSVFHAQGGSCIFDKTLPVFQCKQRSELATVCGLSATRIRIPTVRLQAHRGR